MKNIAIGILFFVLGLAAGSVATAAEKLKVRVFKDLDVGSPLTQQMIRKELESTDRVLFVRKENKKTDVIAELQFKNYLQRVLLAEIPMNWSDEAIKAQIIATKSYTLSKIQEASDRSFHLEGSVEDQAFTRKLDKIPIAHRKKLLRLIQETQALYLTDSAGAVARAFYHADCGGQTIDAPNIWTDARSFGVTKDPFCATRTTSKWQYALPREEFWQKISALKPAETAELPSLFESIILKRFSLQQRVKAVEFVAESKGLSFTGEEIRRALGFSRVKSTQFQMTADEGIYRFTGQGFGHGVGLCQRGAAWMAAKGYTARQILEHYYPQAKIAQLVR